MPLPGGDYDITASRQGSQVGAVVVNVVITDAPFDDPRIEGHIDTASVSVIEEGHRCDADLSIELSYDLARDLFSRRDPQDFFRAVFTGQVKVSGDSSKLLQIPLPSTVEPDPPTAELARRIDEITA